jgi:hypothetical protein
MAGRQDRNRTFGWRAERRSPHVHNEQVAYIKTMRRFSRSVVRGVAIAGRALTGMGQALASLAKATKGLSDVL